RPPAEPMTPSNPRFPPDWEPQAAILIAWPTADPDWAPRLAEVEETYIALAAAITRFQRLVACVADVDDETSADIRLRSNRVDMARVRFVTVPSDDTWLRDSGPIALVAPTPPAAGTAPQANALPSAPPEAEAPQADEGAAFRLLDFR